MSDKEIILLSSAVAAAIADGFNADELNTLGNFITCVGQNLTTAASQKAKSESREERKKEECKKEHG